MPITTLFYTMAVVVLIFPHHLTFRFRALLVICSLHLTGFCVLSVLGPYSGGFIWLFASAVMSGLLLGPHASILAIGANALTLTGLGVLLAWGLLPWSDEGLITFLPWVSASLNLLFLNALTAVPAATMMAGLENALFRQQGISAQLQIERQELILVRKQLRRLAVELIEAEEREKHRIAGLLHEDLQQLLAGARFMLQSAAHSEPTVLEEVKRLLEESIRKSRQLSHELSPAVLHHSGLTAALNWLCLHMREQFGLNVRLDIEPDKQVEKAPLKVFLFRAVQEFLFNIVKHAGVNTAHVQLSGSNNEFVITVSDLGIGFDKSILDTYTSKAGLGLLSLRERARYIGGSLTVESTPAQGSRFILRVPADMENTAHPVPPATRIEEKIHIPTGTPASAAGLGIRVLFADDHKVMRQGLIRLVNGKPDILVVGEAANGREALELTRQLRPDVVIMDVSMPVMDGVEATRQIKIEMPEVRVIGLSMHEDGNISRSMRNAGAEAFLTKTTSSAELLKTIYGIARKQHATSMSN